MIYVTADTHFGHTNILKYCERPFHTIEEMDQCILNNINQRVKPNDILWHLGDFSFGNQSGYRNKIKCKNISLIRGNHDFQVHRNYLSTMFQHVDDIRILRDTCGIFVMCHYAMKVWPHRHHGAYHIFGHSHGKLNDPEHYSMDVGVDVNGYRPLSIVEVKEILNKRFD